MAWTSLTFPFGSLLTSTKMTQLFDNLTALANGDSGAPRIYSSALAETTVGSYGAPLDNPAAYPDVTTYTNNSSAAAQSILIARGGNYRVGFGVSELNGGSTTVYAQICRGVTPVGSLRTTTSSGLICTEVVSGWVAGDVLSIFTRDTGANYYSISSLTLFCGSESLMDNLRTK